MGFSLKKIGKAIGSIASPISNKSFRETVFGKPPSSGPSLPPPNLDFLKDSTELRKLFDISKIPKFDASPYSFLMDLPKKAATFGGTYKAPTDTTAPLFEDFIGAIGQPSTAQEIQDKIDNEYMQQLLEGIDTDTANALGSLKSDYAERGLSGPGMGSDIEAAALGQAAATGAQNKGLIRSQFAQTQAQRAADAEKARQAALEAAYGGRYQVGTAADTQARQIAASGAMSDAEMFNQLLGSGNTGLANILFQGNETTRADEVDWQKLLAEILNQRDLARATGQVGIYGNSNTTSGGKNPILGPVGLNFGFGG